MLNERNLSRACTELSGIDPLLSFVYRNYGKPPLWSRPQGFATLVHIILEQQVSLASARACVDKLISTIGEVVPENFVTLSDPELKAIGFSRQKTAYTRHLAEAVLESRINLDNLNKLTDIEAKTELLTLKGVGDWTADIYLLMAMLRQDIMPKGDLALHTAFQTLSRAAERPDPNEFLRIAERWKPFRSTAARLLWHFYLSERRNMNGGNVSMDKRQPTI